MKRKSFDILALYKSDYYYYYFSLNVYYNYSPYTPNHYVNWSPSSFVAVDEEPPPSILESVYNR